MARRTLDGMARGGIYDQVGGGFHRYSVDARWLVPHFEKMLYDNALLVRAYLHAWLVTGDERYRAVAERDASSTCCASCRSRRRLRVGAGRGHGRGRGADVHVDALGACEALGSPRDEVLEPFEHGRSIIAAS